MPRTFGEVARPGSGSARSAVLVSLRDRGPATRAELARRTGLAPPTITAAVRRLLEAGVVLDAGPSQREVGRAGPPGTRVALDGDLAWVLGAEVGFRTLRVVVCDATGQVRGQGLERLGRDHSADDGLPVLRGLAARVLDQAGGSAGRVVSAGVAVRGPVSSARQQVSQSGELAGWSGLTAQDVAEVLGVPVRLENDANVAALGEHVFGAARGVDTSLTVKFHSGIGAGLIIHGRLFTGARGGAGEIGHTPVDPRGPLCRCGKRGCLDTVAAVPALLDAARPRYGDISVSELLRRVEGGDAGATRLVQDAASAVGDVVANACLLFAPELVVLTGALSRAGRVVLEPVERALLREALPDSDMRPRVVLGELEERGTPLGAAALALMQSGWLPRS